MSTPTHPLAQTPPPPYYAVLFTTIRRPSDADGYAEAAAAMEQLAQQMPGFLGLESVRDGDGVGITVSYWSSLDAIRAWGQQADHLEAQRKGRLRWYEAFHLRICRVEEARAFGGCSG